MTKKITLMLVLLLSTVVLKAQEFKKFKFGVGGGYAIPGGEGAKGGVLLYLEPAYRLQDQILVGARFEFAGMVRGFEEDVNTGSASVSFSGSNSLFGQYYFSNNTFRPFIGAGIGMFNVATIAASVDNGGTPDYYEAVDETKFGFFPRVGFDVSHFTVSLDINLVGKSTIKSTTSSNELTSKNGYIGIRVGGFFGGGRK
jgi:hypothetical protein